MEEYTVFYIIISKCDTLTIEIFNKNDCSNLIQSMPQYQRFKIVSLCLKKDTGVLA